ncbi:uncharacterized protein LOC143885842 [Tasmannia lanceolata]|uniref:uncharacterized protein LOC143885842 n=1 Tax=Tasmannia lanceolata TaxID=3420 RepID=UPI004064452B
MEMLLGNGMTYLSVDAVVDGKSQSCLNGFLATPEYLQSLNFPSMPKHCLELKISTPVILRNLNASIGLCNGTRLIVLNMGLHTIQARIITGDNKGDVHCIPWIAMSTSPEPVFTHGQLYVGTSRVTSRSGIRLLIGEKSHPKYGYTRNVVFKEVLQGL